MAYYDQGTYVCVIRDQGFDVSKEKKTPCFWLRFMPMTINGEEVISEHERDIKLWLTPKTIDRAVLILRGLGWGGASFRDLEPDGVHSFEGVSTELRCSHDQDGDKVYENWEFLAPTGSQSENRKGVAKKLDALFGKAVKMRPATTEAPVPAAPSNETEDEDDAPF